MTDGGPGLGADPVRVTGPPAAPQHPAGVVPPRDGADSDAASVRDDAAAARLQAMVSGLNAIVWERDPETWRFKFVNERIQELLGYSVADWLADPQLWQRIIDPEDRDDAVAAVRRGISEGRDFSLTYRVHTADGRLVWLHHLGHVVADEDGGARALHAVLFDITEQKRREQTAELLAAVGQLLAAPGTVEERLSAVAGLAVGSLCERSSVWLRENDGRYRTVAAAPAETAEQLLALEPVTTPPELEAAYLAGRPFVVDEVSDEMRREATEDEAQYAAVAALRTRSVLVAPLVNGGRVVGALTLVNSASERSFDDADLAVAGELGQRIATMVASEQVAARERQLHEITAALSAAGTVAEAAAELSAGLRRALGAARVVVCTLGEDRLLHLVHGLGYPREQLDPFRTMRPTSPLPITEAARTGLPVWLPDRDAWGTRYPLAAAALLADTHAGTALPLRVGERIVGVVGASFPTRRDFGPGERTFLLTLAGQAAVAFERAALADVRREMADTLQHSLLPRSLPTIDRLSVTARYLPGVQGTQAGGDWYDVLPLEGRGVAVVVGDVVGNGAPAAAVMGQLRSALAAVLLEGHSPARALELLDRYSGQVVGAEVSTVACLLLDPAAGTVTYSRAVEHERWGVPGAGPAGARGPGRDHRDAAAGRDARRLHRRTGRAARDVAGRRTGRSRRGGGGADRPAPDDARRRPAGGARGWRRPGRRHRRRGGPPAPRPAAARTARGAAPTDDDAPGGRCLGGRGPARPGHDRGRAARRR